MAEQPVFRSGCTGKSIWQEYRIYEDRVEFDTHFGLLSVPFEQIESIEISESEVRGLLRGDLHLRNFRPALKLDWANFIRRILFTPDDPAAFKRALEGVLATYRSGERGGS